MLHAVHLALLQLTTNSQLIGDQSFVCTKSLSVSCLRTLQCAIRASPLQPALHSVELTHPRHFKLALHLDVDLPLDVQSAFVSESESGY